MTTNRTLQLSASAAKANIKPGIVLWILLVLFLGAYFTNDQFKAFLDRVADFKNRTGYSFTFILYIFTAGIMPELLKIILFQKFKPVLSNFYNILYSGLIFGIVGVTTDIFYKYQAIWFGNGNGFHTLLCKVTVDQLIFSPIMNSLIMMSYILRIQKFNMKKLISTINKSFFLEKLVPVVVASWFVWVPGVLVVYFMPGALQVPVASCILCFWVLIITYMSNSSSEN